MNRGLMLLLLALALPAQALEPFSATYRLLVDGQPRATAGFVLEVQNEQYSLETLVEPLALPEARHDILEASHGRLEEDWPRPQSYYYAVRGEEQTDMVELFFHWKERVLTLRAGERQEHYKLEEHTQDRLSYLLRAMTLAAGKRQEVRFPRVSTDGREQFTLRRTLRKYLSTPAGRFLAQEVQVQSDKGGERRLWLAVHKGFLPLAIEQKTPRGLLRMELTEIRRP